jgi:hypothetical protein
MLTGSAGVRIAERTKITKTDGQDGDPVQEEHDQRQLEGDAEAERQEQNESHPFADPRLGLDADAGVEAQQEIQHVAKHGEERQRRAAPE